MKAITIKLRDELHLQTRLRLVREGKTMQELVVYLLEQYNKNVEK